MEFESPKYLELSELQEEIKCRVGNLTCWVKVEIESHREVGGHHYINVIEKKGSGLIAAKASARIWYSNAHIIREFEEVSGQKLCAGITVVALCQVDFHPVYGMGLVIKALDASYTIGEREKLRKQTIEELTQMGAMQWQKELALPFFPTRIALISAKGAAGYGDFMKHIESSGYKFDCVLFNSVMQGDNSSSSIVSSLQEIEEHNREAKEKPFDLVLIFRGGGADSDLYCFDDFEMCHAIASCSIPVLTAIGHERDFHVADMVAHDYYKTPTALADALIDWASSLDDKVSEALEKIRRAFSDKLSTLDMQVDRFKTGILYALRSRLDLLDKDVALHEARIKAADPRGILSLGYVLAVDENGTILKNASSKQVGQDFVLRFMDGSWKCEIKDKNI